MTYFLEINDKEDRLYLEILQKENGVVTVYKSLGFINKLFNNEINDPLEYYKKKVSLLNFEELLKEKSKINNKLVFYELINNIKKTNMNLTFDYDLLIDCLNKTNSSNKELFDFIINIGVNCRYLLLTFSKEVLTNTHSERFYYYRTSSISSVFIFNDKGLPIYMQTIHSSEYDSDIIKNIKEELNIGTDIYVITDSCLDFENCIQDSINKENGYVYIKSIKPRLNSNDKYLKLIEDVSKDYNARSDWENCNETDSVDFFSYKDISKDIFVNNNEKRYLIYNPAIAKAQYDYIKEHSSIYNKDKNMCGYNVLVTSSVDTPKEIYNTYINILKIEGKITEALSIVNIEERFSNYPNFLIGIIVITFIRKQIKVLVESK